MAMDICVLPEGCISIILSFTTPRDACALSLVSLTFKSAAYSDVVWEKFLPSDYKDIVNCSVSSINTNNFPSKKELYLHLCDIPLLLHEGKKSLTPERKSGKKCFMIGAKALDITWGDTPQYWKWNSNSDSRFGDVAELLSVCWLNIKGIFDTQLLSPETIYSVYMVIKFAEITYGLDHPAADVKVEFVGGGGDSSGGRSVYLDPECNRRSDVQHVPHRLGLLRHRFGHILRPALPREGHFPSDRKDGWMEIQLGEFYYYQGEDGEVEMGLSEIKSGYWKAGLIVQGIELRPKKNTT